MGEKSWIEKQVDIVVYECEKIWKYLKEDERETFLNRVYEGVNHWTDDKFKEIR